MKKIRQAPASGTMHRELLAIQLGETPAFSNPGGSVGMSLRDYLICQALGGLLAHGTPVKEAGVAAVVSADSTLLAMVSA